MVRLILFFAILSVQSLSFATDRLVYFGGGSPDAKKDPGIFDDAFLETINYAKKSGAQSQFFYRRNHPMLPAEAAKSLKTFTPANFKSKLSSLTQDILTGKMKPGDQTMLIIDSHGAPGAKPGELSITANGEKVSDSELMKLVDAANKKGVKLAILGGTCYSGTLMKYMSDNVCVITGAQPDRVANTAFWETFIKELSIGKNPNLEVAFLRARLDSVTDRQGERPMISTPAGVYVDQILAPLKHGIYSDTDLAEDLQISECRADLSNTNLAKQLKGMYRVSHKTFHATYLGKSLTNQYELLNEKYAAFQRLRDSLQGYFFRSSQNACVKDKCLRFHQVEKVLKGEPLYDCAAMKKELWTACLALKDEDWANAQAIAQRADYKAWAAEGKEKENMLKNLGNLSKDINQQERLIYDELYKKALQQFKGPNACRDFQLNRKN